MLDPQMKRGLLEACVLSALARGDSYGYKIVKDLSVCVQVSESTLYPILRRLESAGALTVYSVEHNSRSAILTITASAALEEPKVSISPTFDMARPVIPMVTATVMEMTTQMLPMRREILIFLASLMPMKRSRMWGMPK